MSSIRAMGQIKQSGDVNEIELRDKMAIVHGLEIIHPQEERALSVIREVHFETRNGADPECVLIYSEPGRGKTTIFEAYQREYGAMKYDTDQKKQPILSLEVPSPISTGSLVDALLDKLGDPLALSRSDTIPRKTRRLKNLMRDRGVELVMLDEFQHFVNSENHKVLYDLAEWFKSLVNDTRVPFIMFGQPSCKDVLEVNRQLGRRTTKRIELIPFGMENSERAKEFEDFLYELDRALPFELISGFTRDEVMDAIDFGTGGVVNSIMKLVRRAAKKALEQNEPQIGMNHLAESFDYYRGIMNKKAVSNPFAELI